MAENPCEGMKIEASVREEPVRILSIEEIKKLLTLAQKKIEAPMKVVSGESSYPCMNAGMSAPFQAETWAVRAARMADSSALEA